MRLEEAPREPLLEETYRSPARPNRTRGKRRVSRYQAQEFYSSGIRGAEEGSIFRDREREEDGGEEFHEGGQGADPVGDVGA